MHSNRSDDAGNIQKAGIFAHEEFARLEFAYA